jgi:hypothetical protein
MARPECGDHGRRLTGRSYPLHSATADALINACVSPAGCWRDCELREALWRGPEAPATEARYLCPLSDWIIAARRAGLEEAALEVIVPERMGEKPINKELLPMQAALALIAHAPLSAPRARLVGNEVLVVMAGNVGVGKTVAASYVVAHLGGRYTTAYEWVRPGLELEPLRTARVLVVDQLGREYLSEYVVTQLEDVIHKRHAARRLTLLLGNLDGQDLLARYQAVIADRLKERGAFLEFGGQSLRGRL